MVTHTRKQAESPTNNVAPVAKDAHKHLQTAASLDQSPLRVTNKLIQPKLTQSQHKNQNTILRGSAAGSLQDSSIIKANRTESQIYEELEKSQMPQIENIQVTLF